MLFPLRPLCHDGAMSTYAQQEHHDFLAASTERMPTPRCSSAQRGLLTR